MHREHRNTLWWKGLSVGDAEAIQTSFLLREMRMEQSVAFPPLARLNYCVLLLRAICSDLRHISKSVMLCLCVETVGGTVFCWK